MPKQPFLAFACAHMTDERLYAAQVAALEARYDCRVFAFRNHDSLARCSAYLTSTSARSTKS